MRWHHKVMTLAFGGGIFLVLISLGSEALAQRGNRFRGPGGMDFRNMRPPQAAEQKPAEEKKDEKDEDKKTDEAKPEEKKDEGPPPVQRPLDPERPADPRELDVKPADDGKISFSFKGQPWPSVLEWLADISNMSLEWEEAPAGYFDFTTRGRYTVDEVRDLVNSVLLNKGFTVLRNGEVLIVTNLKKLDSSLIPRVKPGELDERGTYEIVRTFFDLDWLVAEQASEEIKPLLSTFGKVQALKATNRLDVLDTAGNLRRIRDLIAEEQSDSGQQRLVREFPLRFSRAEEVLDTLNTLLGIETKQANAGQMDPRQLMQAMMMAQQQGGQQGMMQPKKENTVFLAVNAKKNSILAFAPPDKMGVIEQAVEAVDVPAHGKGFMADAQKFKVYRLSGLQPDTLVKVLKDLGSLDPTTKLEVDTKKNALIVYGPLVDHLLITDLVERLDGTSRKFEVIQLRTLSAEYVAGTIITLMNGPEKQNDSGRSRYPYYFFDSGSSQQQTDTSDKFQVEADIERNRLLLKANEVELAEVRALLVKLGEIPADQRYGHASRVIPAAPGPEMRGVFERIKQMLPNPLEIEIDPSALEPSPRRSKETDGEATGRRRAAPSAQPAQPAQPRQGQPRGRSAQAKSPVSRFRLAQDRLEPKESSDENESPAEADPETVEADDAQQGKDAAKAQADESADNDSAAMDEDGQQEDGQQEGGQQEGEKNEGPGDDSTPASESEPANDGGRDDATEQPSEKPSAADEEMLPGAIDLPRRAHAPIKIRLGPQGLVISSSDTDALDQLEELLNRMLPPRTTYEIFTLKHTYAKDMVTLLKDVFKADMSKDSNSRTEVFDMFWNGYRGSSSGQQARASLSRRRPLNFVADPVTNTVLVQGADPTQIAEIEDLIERYDRAEPPNSESVRRTTRVALKYAKAKEVARVLKEVYRDLLSPNDKELVSNQPQQQGPQQRGGNDNFYSAMFSYLTDDPSKTDIVPRFKGMLSVGIDEQGNGVVISAPQIILTEVLKMVKQLDTDARPSRGVVRVLKVRNPGVGNQVHQAVVKKPTSTAPTAEAGNGQTVGANPNAGKVQTNNMGGGGFGVRVSR